MKWGAEAGLLLGCTHLPHLLHLHASLITAQTRASRSEPPPPPIHHPDLPTPRRSANSRTKPGGDPAAPPPSNDAPPRPSPFQLDCPPKGQGGVARPPRVAQVRCRGTNGKDPGGPASLPPPGHGTDSLTAGSGSGRAAAGRRGGAAAPGTAEAATRWGSAARSRSLLSSGSGLGRLGPRRRRRRPPAADVAPDARPAPSAASRAPASSRASDSYAHARSRPRLPPPLRSLPRPPVAGRAQPPLRPPPPARLACARLIRGLPRPRVANQSGRGASRPPASRSLVGGAWASAGRARGE